MNLALGANLAWRLVTEHLDWWKLALMTKYFGSSRLQSLDDPLPHISGSPIWKLLKVVAPLIQSKLSWSPENGDLINVWTDRILGKDPLGKIENLAPLKKLASFYGANYTSGLHKLDNRQ